MNILEHSSSRILLNIPEHSQIFLYNLKHSHLKHSQKISNTLKHSHLKHSQSFSLATLIANIFKYSCLKLSQTFSNTLQHSLKLPNSNDKLIMTNCQSCLIQFIDWFPAPMTKWPNLISISSQISFELDSIELHSCLD